MINVKTSLKKSEEEFVPVDTGSRLLTGRHYFVIFAAVCLCLVMILPSQMFFGDPSPSYLSTLAVSQAEFLARDETEVMNSIVISDRTSPELENYEDYDIPRAMFQDHIAVHDDVITVDTAGEHELAGLAGEGDDEDFPAGSDLAEGPALMLPAEGIRTYPEEEARPSGTWYTQVVSRGDTLSKIFVHLNLPNTTLKKIMARASNEDLTLTIGSRVHFLIDSNNVVKEFVNPLSDHDQVRFTRMTAMDDFRAVHEGLNAHVQDPSVIAGFEAAGNMPFVREREQRLDKERARLAARRSAADRGVQDSLRPRLAVISLRKGGSFRSVARHQGLTPSEIRRIESEVGTRLNLSRLPHDYSFRILYNNVGTNAMINAFEFEGGGSRLAMYRNLLDNNFYEEDKYNPTAGVFRRFPLANSIIITSKFNPRRMHPITRRIMPHNGVDFKAKVGTPVYAPADGTVTFSGFQRVAGYYVIVAHDNAFSTVYMHLSKIEVERGQRVHAGQIIAKTGNTGRSTGPHLHYEIRIKDRAVDPLYVDLPSSTNPARITSQIQSFQDNVRRFKRDLRQERLAMRWQGDQEQAQANN